MQQEKQQIINFIDYSITFIWIAACGIIIGIVKKISDFLISAAIEKYDAKIEDKINKTVKEQLKPLSERIENLAIEVHSVVSNKSVSNIRSELLLAKLEDFFDNKNEKK